MYRPVVPSLLTKFELGALSIDDVRKGYRNESYRVVLNDGQVANVLFYKQEPEVLERIERADEAADHLARAGMPVRIRRDARLLRLQSSGRLGYAGVYNYLPGETIPWEAYTKDHIKLLGWAMSDMHACWQDFSTTHPVSVAAELDELIERMKYYLQDAGVKEALRRKLGLMVDYSYFPRLSRLVRLIGTHTAGQQLHMDMVRGNVLFAPARPDDRWQIGGLALSGVIDFEKTAVGSPLFDIARTLAFLLVDCSTKRPDQVMKYFLRSGYNRRGEAFYNPKVTIGGRTEEQLLSGLIALFLLHDFYKFLRHTPYEPLPQNHHFVRTRDILATYNMVRYG